MLRYLSLPLIAILTLSGLYSYFPTRPASAQEPAATTAPTKELKSIFNGKDLDGWDGDPRLWSVKDGVIRGETTPDTPAQGNTFLIWRGGSTKNFELQLAFRCNDSNNSGIQYRSKHIDDPKAKNRWVVRGYQHELRNEVGYPNVAGFIYDEGGKRGRLCLVGEKSVWENGAKRVEKTWLDETAFKKLFKLNDWNQVAIVAQGDRIQHFLNDQLILEFSDQDPELSLKEGVLALQLHAGKPMWAEFKDIRFRQLPD
jgi:hypothetical protein